MADVEQAGIYFAIEMVRENSKLVNDFSDDSSEYSNLNDFAEQPLTDLD